VHVTDFSSPLSLCSSLTLSTPPTLTHRRLAGFFSPSHRLLPLFSAIFGGETPRILWTKTAKTQTTTMASTEDKVVAKQENVTTWKDSFYNPRTGEFMGRTASSWALILLFYLVFYAFLAGMFALTMWVMLMTLDDNVPKYQDRVPFPGYNDTEQEKNEECTRGEYFLQDDAEDMEKKALCSGLSDTNFGYSEGKPCILLKLNRIIGLKPRGDPYISCAVKKDEPIQMHYFPREGSIDKMYFPYYGKKAHLLLTKEDYNKELAIECKVEGSDLRNNDERDKFLGRVTFRIKVEA
ncbi:hypothetical protein F7725_011957, partial [Dissostichus mawsoni]